MGELVIKNDKLAKTKEAGNTPLDVELFQNKIKSFVKSIYDNVAVMDSGARAATTTFVENNQGDVLIAWEN